MKLICVTALTLAAGALGAPLAAAELSLQTEKSSFGNDSAVLTNLLRKIESESGAIDGILDQYPETMKGDEAEKIAGEVGAHFDNMTETMREANVLLYHLDEDTELVDEDGKPCGTNCIKDKTQQVIKHVGKTTLKSNSKLGVNLMGEHIAPPFQTLSVLVQTLNTSVGGTLATIPARVNKVMLLIDSAISHLRRFKDKMWKWIMGGPRGKITAKLRDEINNRLGQELSL